MRTSDILTEEVFATMAVGYHRTRNLKNLTAIGESGFKAGGGTMYGKGIYLTYSFDDQQDDYMTDHYGPFVVRCKINLHDFIIFDPAIALRVYGGDEASLDQQFSRFGVKEFTLPHDPNVSITAHNAKMFANWLFAKPRKLAHPIKGLVFTGRQDGRVIVAYDPTSVIPFAWARVTDLNKTRETVRWNKITKPPLSGETKSLPEFERAYRFFRQHGFTLVSRGDRGATLIGVRHGDYLSITITQHAINHLIVKCFCTRVDPARTKLPGYAEHRGWPLLYKEYDETLPLTTIMTSILGNHDAMKPRAATQVAFTESLLHRLTKSAVTRHDKPGRDYRQDDIVVTAGSITVTLDSPYQDFTSGKLWIEAKPVAMELGFNDGSRHGSANLEHAYASLLQTVHFVPIYQRLEWHWPEDLQPQFVTDLEHELAKLR